MNTATRKNYLAAEVMTSSPRRLHLMLIEGAIRSAERGRAAWQAGEDARAAEALGRAQEIVGEMLAAIDREAAPELGSKVAGVYLFLFRTLLEAGLERDDRKLDDALQVLQIERETWRQLCEQTGEPPGGLPAPPGGRPAPVSDLARDGGLSLEA